jgi:hypothetical protein
MDDMISGTKAIKTLAVTAAGCWLTIPAHAQGFSKMKSSGPPVETRPKVDEKAYKAALDRIPEPRQKYDPWGVARPAEPAGVAGKSN